MPPAARIASGKSASPKPASVDTLKCPPNTSRHMAGSNFQTGTRCTCSFNSGATIAASSASNSSAGPMRANSRANTCSPSAPVNSAALNSPVVISTNANPACAPAETYAARKLFCAGCSRPVSTTVPGVTTRTTSRGTRPFMGTVPICSQIATRCPRSINTAR